MTAARPLDRRRPQRGDERRAALLQALDRLLQDGELEAVNVEEISRRAGITRSAFYFYFESKAAAVGALVTEMYDDILAATRVLVSEDGDPRARIERTIERLFLAWADHEHLYRAMLEARQTSSTVRELWDADREAFVQPVAAMIDAERRAGRAPDGPDSSALATVLLDLNDRALERLARGGRLPLPQHREAVSTVWLRTIYGSAA